MEKEMHNTETQKTEKLLKAVLKASKKHSKTAGFCSILFGFLSLFMIAIVFVPLGLGLGILSLLKRDLMNVLLGGFGVFLSLVGMMTSPVLLSLLGFSVMGR